MRSTPICFSAGLARAVATRRTTLVKHNSDASHEMQSCLLLWCCSAKNCMLTNLNSAGCRDAQGADNRRCRCGGKRNLFLELMEKNVQKTRKIDYSTSYSATRIECRTRTRSKLQLLRAFLVPDVQRWVPTVNLTCLAFVLLILTSKETSGYTACPTSRMERNESIEKIRSYPKYIVPS